MHLFPCSFNGFPNINFFFMKLRYFVQIILKIIFFYLFVNYIKIKLIYMQKTLNYKIKNNYRIISFKS
jgi:hypothetical protein